MSYIKPPAPIHSPTRTLAPDVHRAPQGPPRISSGANPTIYGPGSNGPKLPGSLTYPIRAVRNQEDREKMGKAADAKAEKAASKGAGKAERGGPPPLGAPSTMPSGTAASGTLGRTAPPAPEPVAIGSGARVAGALGPGRSDEIHAKLMGMGAARAGGTTTAGPIPFAGALGTESHARASARSVINSGGDTPWGGNVRPQGSHGVQPSLTNPDQARGALNEGPRQTTATGPRQGTGRPVGAVGTTSSTGNFDARLGSSPVGGFDRQNESGYRADNTTTTMRERMKATAIDTTSREVATEVAKPAAKPRASRAKGSDAGADAPKAKTRAPRSK